MGTDRQTHPQTHPPTTSALLRLLSEPKRPSCSPGHHPSSVWPLIGWSIISLASHWPNTIKEKWRSPSDAVVNDDVTWRSPRDVVMMTRSSGADLCATRLSRAVGAHCNQLKFSIAYISTFLNNFVSRILWSKLGNQATVSLRENISKAWVKVRGS